MRRSTICVMMILSALGVVGSAYADCPEGVRPVGESEQQVYLSLQQAIRAALPPTPAGWTLRDPMAKIKPAAPKDVCKGLDPMPGWYGEYFWDVESKRHSEKDRERDAKIRKAMAWTPEEEKEVRAYQAQARDLEYKARGAIKTNPDEAARLRAEAKPFSEKANAVWKAHNERVAPEVAAINKEYDADRINTLVTVTIGTWEESAQTDSKEPLQISGVPTAFVNSQKEMVLIFGQKLPSFKESGGIGTKPRLVTAIVKGDRQPAEVIAKLLGSSGLGEVGKK